MDEPVWMNRSDAGCVLDQLLGLTVEVRITQVQVDEGVELRRMVDGCVLEMLIGGYVLDQLNDRLS
jgi:hypothetical protein